MGRFSVPQIQKTQEAEKEPSNPWVSGALNALTGGVMSNEVSKIDTIIRNHTENKEDFDGEYQKPGGGEIAAKAAGNVIGRVAEQYGVGGGGADANYGKGSQTTGDTESDTAIALSSLGGGAMPSGTMKKQDAEDGEGGGSGGGGGGIGGGKTYNQIGSMINTFSGGKAGMGGGSSGASAGASGASGASAAGGASGAGASGGAGAAGGSGGGGGGGGAGAIGAIVGIAQGAGDTLMDLYENPNRYKKPKYQQLQEVEFPEFQRRKF